TRILSGQRIPFTRPVAPVRRASVRRSTTSRAQSRVNNRRPGNRVVVDGPATVVAKPGVEIQEVSNLPRVYVVTTITLSSKMPLGNDAGQVILDIQGISLPTELRAWTSESVTCTLPMMELDQPKEARLIMVTAKGEVAHSISVLLMPAKAPEVAPME
ncbi:MAG: hypothetical protein VB877_12265, partial [Pirellulaceae bacterium]